LKVLSTLILRQRLGVIKISLTLDGSQIFIIFFCAGTMMAVAAHVDRALFPLSAKALIFSYIF